MTQQVLYAIVNGVILQWQDTAAFAYSASPTGTATLPVTSTEWASQSTPQYVSNPGTSAAALVNGTPPATPPTLAKQAATLVAAGITVTSAGTSALSGVYSVQSGVPFGQEQIAAEAQFISSFSEFTNGSTTNLPWYLANGSEVVFPTTTEFLAFAKAAGQFISAVTLAVAQNGTLPSAAVNIP